MTEREKRERILRSARDLFLHYGLKKTTIEEIARAAGIGKGTVYLYFKTKEEILKHIGFDQFRSSLAGLQERLRRIPRTEERFRLIMKMKPLEIYEFAQEHPHAKELLPFITEREIEASGYGDSFRTYHTLLQTSLEEGVRQGEFHTEDPAAVVNHIHFMSAAFLPGNCQMSRESLEEMVDRFTDLVLCSLQKE